jgi:hypothetical protein
MFSRNVVAVALLFSALAACHDTTAPPPPDLEVTVSISQMLGPGFTSDNDGPLVTCELHLVASTKGTGSAKWQGGTFRFFIGRDHVTPVDTTFFIARDIADSWGGDSISAGTSQSATWTITGGFPFSGEFEFRYAGRSGKVSKSVVPFSCGPSVNGETPATTISALTLTPATGEVEAGQPVKVSFQVTAPAGIWQTHVELRGPCTMDTTLQERLETATITRDLTLNVPGSCALGVPITVAVTTLDGAAQLVVRTLNSTVVLADHERPHIGPLFFPPGSNSPQSTPSGDYFAGDSMLVWSTGAHDNHRVAAVLWEVLPSGFRDSATTTGLSGFWLRLRPEWTGQNIQLRMWARDEVGLVSDTVLTPPDSIRIHPTVDRPTRTVELIGDTRDVVIDPRRNLAYLRQVDDHRIVVFSLGTMQVQSTLVLAAAANGFDLTPSGDSLIFVLGDHPALGVIDTRQSPLAFTELPLSGLDASSGDYATNVRIASNGKAYVMINGPTSARRRLLEIDLATRAQRTRTDAGVNGVYGSGPLERSLDHSVLIANLGDLLCLQRFDVVADAFSSCVMPFPPQGFLPATLDLTGQRAAMGLTVYDASLHTLPRSSVLPVVGVPPSALSADGQTLLVSVVPLGFVRVRTSDGAVLDRTFNPVRPQIMRVSPDGTFLVSIDDTFSGTTKISVIDLR